MELEEYLQTAINFKTKKKKSSFDLTQNGSELARASKRGNFILRQELRDFKREFSIKCSITTNLLIFGLFMLVGIPIIIESKNLLKTQIEYQGW